METENGQWIMQGVQDSDPRCIQTVESAIAYIQEIGFLPLFKNEIADFSLEERTIAAHWWNDNPFQDPWMWRAIIARQKNILYGKFFDKKAGFITREWLPYFANYRRDGYDFDSMYQDGLVPRKHKMIMDHFIQENGEPKDFEILSIELRRIAGFGKDGQHGYEGAITSLQMQLYLCSCDFRKRRNKQGKEYGWDVAVYSTPENLCGYDLVTSAYQENPKESLQRIVNHIKALRPGMDEKQILKVVKR